MMKLRLRRTGLFLVTGSAAIIAVLFIGYIYINNANVYALDENKCFSCHSNKNLNKTSGDGTEVSLYVNEEAVSQSAHKYIDCTTCHPGDPHKIDTPLTKLSLAQKCSECHQYEYKLHQESIHGEQLAQGNSDVATCVDCHSMDSNPHSVVRVLEYNAPTYKKNIAQTCAECHDDKELMADYGIVEKVYESYMRSFHGKAMQLGTYKESELDKATCTNCHSVHDIKSVSDPDSPVAGLENLSKTCEQCHLGAGAEFASSFLGHKEASPANNPPVHYIEKFFAYLLRTVIGFGVAVVVTAIGRFSINKWRS